MKRNSKGHTDEELTILLQHYGVEELKQMEKDFMITYGYDDEYPDGCLEIIDGASVIAKLKLDGLMPEFPIT
jgi:hypothetical protein